MGKPLQSAALAGKLATWTSELTSAVVETCDAMGWRAAAKGYLGQVLPVARREYLALDVVAFADSSARWPLPIAVIELENSPVDDLVCHALWKVLCVRAAARFVFAYRRDGEAGVALIGHLTAIRHRRLFDRGSACDPRRYHGDRRQPGRVGNLPLWLFPCLDTRHQHGPIPTRLNVIGLHLWPSSNRGSTLSRRARICARIDPWTHQNSR